MTKPCNPIPCPSFTTFQLGDVVPVGWWGADIRYLEGGEDFKSRPVPDMVTDIVAAVEAQAAEIRYRYRYADDTVIYVKLPRDSNLGDLFELVKGVTDGRIQFI